jgi:hypothetical protein
MKKLSLCVLLIILSTLSFINAFSQQPNYDTNFLNVNPGNGNGIKFWFSDQYKIAMGSLPEYQYGPVTGFSIKMNMASSVGWGWTWGVAGQIPIAALNNQGNMKMAGSLDVVGSINASSILINNKPFAGGGSQWATVGSTINYSGNVGIGTIAPSAKLHIMGIGSLFNPGNNLPISGDLVIQSNTGGKLSSNGSAIEFVLPANTDGTNFWGQGRIITIAGSGNNADATGKMILGTRRYYDKGNGLAWNYGDDIVINGNGNVGIGTISPDAKLAVKGTIHTQEVKVDLSVPGPDYVFEPTYNLKPLAEIEAYIKENKHLPEVPSAKVMEKNGVQLGEMNMLLLKKVEELTLYIIEQSKRIEALENKLQN